MNLAVENNNASTAKDDLRKAYEERNDIPKEKRALIDTFLKEDFDKDYEMHNAFVELDGDGRNKDANMHKDKGKLMECSESMNNMSPNPKSNVSKSCIGENSGINKIDTQISEIVVNADNSRITVNTKTFSYANDVTNNDIELDKCLFFFPTGLNDSADEAVIFEEELVFEGVKKWHNTVCGYFVGCRMSLNEMMYNLRRMLGRPLMMDSMIAAMCHNGTRRTSYAKVLVEIDVNKEMQDQIKVVYKDAMKNTNRTKFVKTECVWRPVMCSTCKVFGHSEKGCKSKEQDTQAEDDVNLTNDTPPSLEKRISVDWFILRKQQPSEEDSIKWTYDMKKYCKYRWQQVNLKKDRSNDEENVIEENDATNMNVIADEIIGRDTQIVN
ncbi:hypothetical protein Tco_0245566 [Tanacetum coccineum]